MPNFTEIEKHLHKIAQTDNIAEHIIVGDFNFSLIGY